MKRVKLHPRRRKRYPPGTILIPLSPPRGTGVGETYQEFRQRLRRTKAQVARKDRKARC
jgi:broad specificity phosphatase PhoE